MNGELVSVWAADGVPLDGVLVRPETSKESNLPIDLVIMHHGVGDHFYNHRVFDPVATHVVSEGCAVLCVNNRGHDTVYAVQVGGEARLLGAAYETVDDCRLDWDAWITFGASLGYGRIGLWGHSLGAVKTIYYLAATRDDRVVAAVANSPPRQSYQTYPAQPPEERAMFVREYEAAKQAVDEGDPERLITTEYRRRTVFAARTFTDKYGPESRYDVFPLVPKVEVPLFITWGGLEPLLDNTTHVAFYQWPDEAPRLAEGNPHFSYAEVPGADHFYTGVADRLWGDVHGWFKQL
jgi:pimeloyl-ACP methyl ester carboxylesterase